MTTPSGQPDKTTADDHDAEATLPGDVPMPDAPDAAETLDEIPAGGTGETDSVDETILSQSSHSLTEALTGSGRPPSSKQASASEECDFPEEFGRYTISEQLGRGAMGAVFLARDTQLNRDVALKVPTFSDRSPANMIERFYREARAAATLTHPNICPVYDVGEYNGVHFISMGYIEGRPLSAYIESGKKQPERQAAAVVRKLALALQEAHDKGIIHRDLKPANIMIDRRSEPIVMDFGLARVTSDTEEARLTREGTVMGSPAYMSPEQVEGKELGPQCDVYSLGVVFYELLTGRTPYQGTVVSVIGQILAANPRAPVELRPDISPECSAVCLKAMASRTSDRFESMTEFAQALGAFIKGDVEAIETFVELDSDGVEPSVDEMQSQKATATSLIRKKQFRDAIAVLEPLSELQGTQAADVVAWAKRQLPRAKEHYQKAVDESKALLRRAKKSMAGHDYERASHQLSQIPPDLRNNTVSDLKAEADELVEEVRRLSDEVAYAVRSGVHDDMLPTVERLLELKPQHRQANDLYEQIFRSDRPARSTRGQRQRRKSQAALTFDPRLIAGGVVAIVVLILLAAFWPESGESPDDRSGASNHVSEAAAENTADAAGSSAAPRVPDTSNSVGMDNDLNVAWQPIREFLENDRRRTPEDFLRTFDTDADRHLSDSEISSRMIDRFDRSGDSKLSLNELRPAFDQAVSSLPDVGGRFRDRLPPRQPRPFPEEPVFVEGRPGGNRPGLGPDGRPEDIFHRHDRNKDGILSGDEIPPFFSGVIDRNRNGEVTLDELRRAAREFGSDVFALPREGTRKPPRPRE